MIRLFVWMQEGEGWKTILSLTYAIVCIMDFVIMPLLLNYDRQEVLKMAYTIARDTTLDKSIALEMLKDVYRTHTPYTLQGVGSTFHLAFGALLTGSAIGKFKEKL